MFCWLQCRWFNFWWVHEAWENRNCCCSERLSKRSGGRKLVYLEELELERERWRLRPGDLERDRRRAGERLLGERDLWGHKHFFKKAGKKALVVGRQEEWATKMYLLLMRGGLRRHIGGGGGILRGGEGLRGGGRTRWASTADAVISCPSIWPINTKII